MKKILSAICALTLLLAPLFSAPAENDPLSAGDSAYIAGETAAVLRLEPADDARVLAALYPGAPVTVLQGPLVSEDYLCVAVGDNSDKDWFAGYVRVDRLVRATRQTLPQGVMTRDAELEGEGGGVTVGSVSEGGKVSLVGRDNLRWFVRADGVSGAVKQGDVRIDSAAAQLGAAELPWSEAARETAQKALDAYVSDCAAKYGDDLRQWPVEAQAEYDARLYAAGLGDAARHAAAPREGELDQTTAENIALGALQNACGYAYAPRADFQVRISLEQSGANARRTWVVEICDRKATGAAFQCFIDARTGETTYANGEQYLAQMEQISPERVEELRTSLLSKLEEERGAGFRWWTLEEQLAYYQSYDAWSLAYYGLPGAGDLTQDQALEAAYSALEARYGVSRETLEGYFFTVEFFIGRDFYLTDTDDGVFYQFEFFTRYDSDDEANDWRYSVRVRADNGEILSVGDYMRGNG